MGIEIERKFLVDKDRWLKVKPKTGDKIIQGYLLKSIEKTIRVRVKGNRGFITIKGKTKGISRAEYEYEIPLSEAIELLDEFCPQRIEKMRYELVHDQRTWVVDEFIAPQPGLILAEIELSEEKEKFDKPNWIEEEVSDQPKYYNANMI